VAACLVYCVSRILFRMSLAMDVPCATRRVRVSRYTQDMLPHSTQRCKSLGVFKL